MEEAVIKHKSDIVFMPKNFLFEDYNIEAVSDSPANQIPSKRPNKSCFSFMVCT